MILTENSNLKYKWVEIILCTIHMSCEWLKFLNPTLKTHVCIYFINSLRNDFNKHNNFK